MCIINPFKVVLCLFVCMLLFFLLFPLFSPLLFVSFNNYWQKFKIYVGIARPFREAQHFFFFTDPEAIDVHLGKYLTLMVYLSLFFHSKFGQM